MGRVLVQRLIGLVGAMIAATTVMFFGIRMVPGDPALVLAGDDPTPEYLDYVRRDLGLDQPLPVQYVRYMARVLQGDLGTSVKDKRPVLAVLGERYPATVALAACSVLVALIVGVGLGTAAALRRNTWLDSATMAFAEVGISVPTFLLGLMLALIFGVYLRWLPAGGSGGPEYLILPAITQGLLSAGIIGRTTRASLLREMRRDWIRTANAKGLAPSIVFSRHTLRNALIPMVTVAGISTGHLLGGSVVAETVFAWPGVGALVIQAILARDYAVVQGAILLLALIFGLTNLIIDLSYAVLDPRLRTT